RFDHAMAIGAIGRELLQGGAMKRIVLSLLALGLVVLGLAGIAPSILSRVGVQTAVQADTEKTISVPSSRTQPIKLDVACDCRTFAYNRGAVFPDVVRGDGFIVNGKIFPPGTLPTGTAANDPNDPGSIGDWICRGTNTGVDDPGAFVTQYHLLANGRGLVSEGAARVPEGQAA